MKKNRTRSSSRQDRGKQFRPVGLIYRPANRRRATAAAARGAFVENGTTRGGLSPGKFLVLPKSKLSVADYVSTINKHWRQPLVEHFCIADLCAHANRLLDSGEKAAVRQQLLFKPSRFSKYVRIGQEERLRQPEAQIKLPPRFTVLYLLTRFDDAELAKALNEVIHPDITRKELQEWRNSYRAGSGAGSD